MRRRRNICCASLPAHWGTVSEYTYDDYGNQLTTKTSDGTAFMQTTTVYDEQGNHVKQQIDARGKAETRQTDDELDTLQSVTDARGQVLHYTYVMCSYDSWIIWL